ncbi:MAG: hypothetical protein IJ783_06585 [Kiritimatiellae bacterium]|nr:hypothetical protein [Kiritimatiellia bacterium]
MKTGTGIRIERAFVVLWMAILFSNGAAKLGHKLVGWPRVDSTTPLRENRSLAEFPDLRKTPFKKLGAAFSSWYDDHFARRADIVGIHNALQFRVLKHPIGEEVPGVGGWVFRRRKNWPECNDWLGACPVSGTLAEDWRTLFEGRAAWAEAHGTRFLTVVTPTKAQVHPEKMTPNLRFFRRTSGRERVRPGLAGSFAEPYVLFLTDRFAAEAAAGHEVFYEEDHHVNALGCWLLYDGMVAKMRELWFPDLPPPPPFYGDAAPPAVEAGDEPGCWVRDRRLVVSVPGSRLAKNKPLRIDPFGPRYPNVPVYVEQPGERRFLLFGNDSYLLFPLSTWHRGAPHRFALPLGPGFDRAALFIFRRFDTPMLESTIKSGVPDVMIDQYPESRLVFGPKGLDETMRRAAAFARAEKAAAARAEPAADAAPAAGAWRARAVFENVPDGGVARLFGEDGAVLAEEPVPSGVRRAVFFAPVPVRPVSAGLRVPPAPEAAPSSFAAFPSPPEKEIPAP